MPPRRRTEPTTRPRRPPATTPEAREQQLISLAVDLVERKLRDGTASSQETVHFLKLGSSREKLEQERLRADVEVAQKRIETMESSQRMEEMMGEALRAFRSYAGQEEPDDHYDD